MVETLTENFILQLDDIIDEYTKAVAHSGGDEMLHDLSTVDLRDLATRALSTIERATGQSSPYGRSAKAAVSAHPNAFFLLPQLIGIAKSVRHDLAKGYVRSFEELVHGDVFADYLDMAEHLNKKKFKDAAAVIAGSTLEAHLKQLCAKISISTSENARPRNAETLNAELVKAGAYEKNDQKNITAWLDLRNSAAHGGYDKYAKGQVSLLISGIRDFITRHPA